MTDQQRYGSLDAMMGCVFEDRANDLLLAKDELAKFLDDQPEL